MALIPAIAYHITQSIMDTLVAHRFRENMEQKPSPVATGGTPANSA